MPQSDNSHASSLTPDWLQAASVQRLIQAFEMAHIEMRFVGGCVRNTLCHQPVTDIDIATPAVPDIVAQALAQQNIRTIPTGREHGTITALVDDASFEITTLRQDVTTDGRHAKVCFTDCWQEDAQRRDFTINALMLSPDGTLYDYTGGRADLASSRVRFIGDAALRIREDYLRILRYFRFWSHYGGSAHEAGTLAAIGDSAAGMAQLSRERIRDELGKILISPRAAQALASMNELNLWPHLQLPTAQAQHIARVQVLAARLQIPVEKETLLSVAFPVSTDVLCERLALSRAQKQLISQLQHLRLETPSSTNVTTPHGLNAARLAYRYGAHTVIQSLPVLVIDTTITQTTAQEWQQTLQSWQRPLLPVNGDDLLALGWQGPALGQALKKMEEYWLELDFAPDRDALLAYIKRG